MLVTGALTAIAYGTVETHEHGWGSPVALVPLVLGVLGLGVFVLVESRTASPLVPLALLTRRTVAGTTIIQVLSGAIFFAMWYFLSLYLQSDLGYSPLEAGLGFLPHAVTLIATGRGAPYLLRRMTPRTPCSARACVAIAGMLLQAAMLDGYVLGVMIPGILMCAGRGAGVHPAGRAREPAGCDVRSRGWSPACSGPPARWAARSGWPVWPPSRPPSTPRRLGYSAVFLVGAGLMALSIVVALVFLARKPR